MKRGSTILCLIIILSVNSSFAAAQEAQLGQGASSSSPPDWINKTVFFDGDRVYSVGSFPVREIMVSMSEFVSTSRLFESAFKEECGSNFLEDADRHYPKSMDFMHLSTNDTYQNSTDYFSLNFISKQDYELLRRRLGAICSKLSPSKIVLSAAEISQAYTAHPLPAKSKDGAITLVFGLYYLARDKLSSGTDQIILPGDELLTAMKDLKLKTILPIKQIDKIILTKDIGGDQYIDGGVLGLDIYFKKPVTASISVAFIPMLTLHAPIESHWDLIKLKGVEEWRIYNLAGDIGLSGLQKLDSISDASVAVYRLKSGKTSLYGEAMGVVKFKGGGSYAHRQGIDLSTLSLSSMDKFPSPIESIL